MNDDIYFEILKRLAKSGLNQKTDISDLLRIYLSNNIDLGESIKNGIYTYLQNMELYSHIGFKNNTVVFEENNLNEISVSAWILPAGLIFYQQKIQIDVITNSNNLSRWNIFATLCLALLW